MSDLTTNKILAAVLAVALVIVGLNAVMPELFEKKVPAKAGYAVTVAPEAGEVDDQLACVGAEGLDPEGERPHAEAPRRARSTASRTSRSSEAEGGRSRSSSRNSSTTDSGVRSSTGAPSLPRSGTAPVRASS